jgi:hypothetical protein
LRRKLDRQHLLAVGFFLHDDLGQDRVSNVASRLGVQHLKIDALSRHPRKIVERDVAR